MRGQWSPIRSQQSKSIINSTHSSPLVVRYIVSPRLFSGYLDKSGNRTVLRYLYHVALLCHVIFVLGAVASFFIFSSQEHANGESGFPSVSAMVVP